MSDSGTKRYGKGAVAAVVMLALLMAAPLASLPAGAANDPPAGGGWVGGQNWVVTDNRTYQNVWIGLNQVNLIVQRGGNLTLDNVDLLFNMAWNGQLYLEVQSGGTLNILNGSLLYSNAMDRRYYIRFRADSTVNIDGSTIQNIGNWWDGRGEFNGIAVQSDNVTINGSIIQYAYNGVFAFNSRPAITNNTVQYTISTAIVVSRGNALIAGNTIRYMARWQTGITVMRGQATITGNTFSGVNQNSPEDDIVVTDSSSARIEGNRISHPSEGGGIYVINRATAEILNNTIAVNNRYALYLWAYSSANFTGNQVTGGVNDAGIYIWDHGTVRADINTITTRWVFGAVQNYGTLDLINNTLRATDDNGIWYSDHATGKIEGNNITTRWDTGSAQNFATVDLINNTIVSLGDDGFRYYDYSAGTIRGNTLTVNDLGFTAEDGSRLAVGGNTIRAVNNGIVSGGGLVEGGTVVLEGNIINSTGNGFFLWGTGRITSTGDTISTVNGAPVNAVESSYARVERGTLLSASGRGVYLSGFPVVDIVNSTVYAPSDFDLMFEWAGGNGTANFINTTFAQNDVFFGGPNYRLNVFWFADTKVRWQNGKPAAGVAVGIANTTGATVFSGATGADGSTGPVLLQEYTRNSAARVTFTPHTFTARKGTLSAVRGVTVDRSMDVLLSLVDTSPPLVAISGPAPGSLLNTTNFTLGGTARDDESGIVLVETSIDGVVWSAAAGTANWSASLSLRDGPYTIRIRALSGAGLTGGVDGLYTIDTAILLTVDWPADGLLTNRSPVTVNGTTDTGANVTVNGVPASAPYGTFSVAVALAEGENTLRVTATDRAGNTASLSRRVTLDTIPPPLRLLSPGEVWTLNSTVKVEGLTEPGATVDIGGRPASVEYGYFSLVVDVPAGRSTLRVVAHDAAGNTNETTATVTRYIPDITVAWPLEGALMNTSTIEVRGRSSLSPLTVNGVPANFTGDNFTATLALSDGTQRILVEWSGPGGLYYSTVRTVRVDTTPPPIVPVSPPAGTLLNRTKATVTALSESGARVFIGGVEASPAGTIFTAEVTLAEGPNSLILRAVDAAGNENTTTLALTVDTTPPPVEFSSPKTGDKLSGKTTVVSGKAEPGSRVTVNGREVALSADGRFETEVPLVEGENTIRITAVDAAGNVAGSELKVTRALPFTAAVTDQASTPLPWFLLAVGIVAGVGVGYMAAASRRRKRAEERPAGLPEPEPEPRAAAALPAEPAAPAPAPSVPTAVTEPSLPPEQPAAQSPPQPAPEPEPAPVQPPAPPAAPPAVEVKPPEPPAKPALKSSTAEAEVKSEGSGDSADTALEDILKKLKV